MVVWGGGVQSRPVSRAQMLRAASRPQAALSMYPSKPVICPAKNTLGCSFRQSASVSTAGLSKKVLRCMTP